MDLFQIYKKEVKHMFFVTTVKKKNRFKWQQGKLLNKRGNILTVRIVKYWDRLYREVVAQIGIGILKKKKNLLELLT